MPLDRVAQFTPKPDQQISILGGPSESKQVSQPINPNDNQPNK